MGATAGTAAVPGTITNEEQVMTRTTLFGTG
jgi:hypothetical protein